MRVVNIGRGLYEVHDDQPLPYAVHVLGDGSCTCSIYRERLSEWKDPVRSKRVWCPHLEAAARVHNDRVAEERRRARFPAARTIEDDFNEAKQDLVRMLGEMTEQENDSEATS